MSRVIVSEHTVEVSKKENPFTLSHIFTAKCLVCQRTFNSSVTIRDLVQSHETPDDFLKNVENRLIDGFNKIACNY